jgi:hypothetical protein
MHRILALVLALAPSAAFGQSLGCIERPVGQPMDITVLVPVPGQPRARAAVTLPPQPSHGTDCIAVAPPPRDILRGEPSPSGNILRTDDPRTDLLRNAPAPRPPTGSSWR